MRFIASGILLIITTSALAQSGQIVQAQGFARGFGAEDAIAVARKEAELLCQSDVNLVGYQVTMQHACKEGECDIEVDCNFECK